LVIEEKSDCVSKAKSILQSDKRSGRPVALITGAGRGIGAAIALELARNGFDIALNDICEKEHAMSVIDEIVASGVKAVFIKADVASKDGRQSIIDVLKKEMGRIDLLVNNAGVSPKVRMDILEVTEESYDRVMTINLKGPFFLTQLVANWMIELKKFRNELEPKIVNISSISAYTSSTSRGEYCISKAGVSMMTKLYADRLSEYGVNVYEIRPGIIFTPMTEPVKEKYDKLISEGITPIKRWGTPEDVAKAVVAIAKGYFPFSTGEVFNVDGGFHIRRL